MASTDRSRAQEVKPPTRTRPVSGGRAPSPSAPTTSGSTKSMLPSPQVAAAILAGAEQTVRAHSRASTKKPPTAPTSLASEKSAARVKIEPMAPKPAAPTPAREGATPRVGSPALTLVPTPAAHPGARPPVMPASAKSGMAVATPMPTAKPVSPSPVEGPAGAVPETSTKLPPATGAAAAPPPSRPAVAAALKKGTESAEAGAEAKPEVEAAKPAPTTDGRARPEGAKPEKGKGEGKEGKAAADGPVAAEPEGGGAAGPSGTAVKLHIPEPPSEVSPATARRIHGVQTRAGGKAAAHGDLPSGASQVGDAQKAVTEPDAEAIAKAQAALIAQVKPAPSDEIVKLCERIREVIRNKRPPDEDALMEAEPEGEALDAGNQLNSTVADETKKVQDNYGSMNTPPAVAAVAQGEGPPPQPPAADSAAVHAKAAVPDAVPAGNVSLDADAAESKKKMQDAGMDSPAAQLAESGPVAEARGAQGELEQAAKEDPAKILSGQEEALAKAEGDMAALQAEALAALTTSRAATVKSTASRQHAMVGTETSMRSKASAEAQNIFNATQTLVDGLLKPLATHAMKEWEDAKTLLVTKFKADLKPVQDRVDKRHSGVGGFFVGLWDAVTGLPDWAEEAYTKAETNFGDGVIAKLTEISIKVNSVIEACDALIEDARTRIAKIFADLPESLRTWATEEQGKFDGQFDQLHNRVIAARDNFNKDLTERASQAVDEVRAEIADLRKKAGGLIGRIVNAVSRFLDDPVKFIIEALLDLLGIPKASFWAVVAKIKKVISDIADDPLSFASNLLEGLGKGFSQFFDNILSHLLKGFLSWLTGGLGDVGVQLPKDLSPKSILTFFLQLMGITWPRIRKILAKLVGEKNVALLEKVYSLVSFLMEKGPEGIYEMIKEKLDPQSIVDQVVQLAVDFLISAVVKAVSARIILLFNPVGAILQALEAIYRVLKWIFQNAARIFTLIETVVNGIADILAGSIGSFANAIEKALGMLIAPVISFLADYLGFGDLPSKIAEKIKSFQEWILGLIEKALVWMIEKGKALLAAVGLGGKDKDEKKDGKFDGQIGKTVNWVAEKHPHKLWIEEIGASVAVRMSSVDTDVATQLDEYEIKAKELPEEKQKDVSAKIATAQGLLSEVQRGAGEVKQAAGAEEKPPDLEAKDDAVESAEQQLVAAIKAVQETLGIDPEKVKADAAADIQKLPHMMESPEELSESLRQIFKRHQPQGLRKISVNRGGKAFQIQVAASAANFAEHLIGLTGDGEGGCSIMVQIDGRVLLDPNDPIAKVFFNAGRGGPHAEARLYSQLDKIISNLRRETRLIEIWIRYSPCQDRCAFVLERIEDEIHKTHQLVQFRWYFEDLWISSRHGHTRQMAEDVVREYNLRGITLIRRADAAEMEIGGE